jgi:triacylglycerol esterase/lipase EstA (alpha/beta hydrolase family)
MTARVLKLLLLVELTGMALVALGVMVLSKETPAWLALLYGFMVLMAVRLAISANNFHQSWRYGSATPAQFQLGLAGKLRLFFGEFMATMVYSSWTMPLARAGKRIYPGATLPPVLLVHGWGCNSGYWVHLLPRLDAAGISHARLDLEPMLGSIDDYQPMVDAAVNTLCRDSGASQVIVIAHSMGGLVARNYLRAKGTDRIARIITLGTPHHGTELARFGPGRNAYQMRFDGDGAAGSWLAALASSEDPAKRALITSIFTHHDNIVAPQTSGYLAGARNIEFGGIGHVALGCNTRILDCVMAELAMVPVKEGQM